MPFIVYVIAQARRNANDRIEVRMYHSPTGWDDWRTDITLTVSELTGPCTILDNLDENPSWEDIEWCAHQGTVR